MARERPDGGIVLPEPGKQNVLITTALPYVNNVPHLGNIIGSVLSADVFARYCRARGINTLYVGGTDEYGTSTETRALMEGCTAQGLCDKYHAVHAQLQTEITQGIFLKLYENGYLEERTTSQLYCEEHQSFLADRLVEGECPRCAYVDARGDQCDLCGNLLEALELVQPRCKLDGSTPVTKDTKHIFLELDKLQPGIETFFNEASRKGGWPNNAKSITSSWLKEGLQPRSITRDIKWGTAVPLAGYEEKVIYSWFDACIGYVSITACYTDQWEQWWRNPDNVKLHQFIGKDNVVYHSVMFPATQIGTREEWTKLHHLSTTDYLTYEGGKFSKSRGMGVFGDSVQKTGVPYIVPDWSGYHEPAFDTWRAEVNGLLAQYIQELDAVKLRAALFTVLQISQRGNSFLQASKLDSNLRLNEPAKCDAVISLAVNLVHLLGSLLAPFMPETSRSINTQLRAELFSIPDHWAANSIKPGHEIGQAEHLFSRIEPGKAEEWREMFGRKKAEKVKGKQAAMKVMKNGVGKGKGASGANS